VSVVGVASKSEGRGRARVDVDALDGHNVGTHEVIELFLIY
jgi:hypothetical protein